MEIQLNLDAHQAIKNLTQAGIDEEHAAALVSTFGSFSNNIATKDDLAVVKQELMQRDDAMEKTLTQEMGAMEARQSQKSDYLKKTLTQEMGAMEARQSQKSDYLEKTLTQEMSAMDTKQSQRSDYLGKNLTQRNDALEKTLVREIAKSRYVMFAAGATGALVMLGLYEALGRFLN